MAKRKTILIADDSEINRAILVNILNTNYRLLEAENGKEVMQLLEQERYDVSLVLLDIHMPVMDGFQVLEEMQKNSLIKGIPVIIISSENSIDFIRKGYTYGVSDYISKPFDYEVVLQRVRNTIALYTKLELLQNTVTQQMIENEKNSTLMVNMLSTIVEFRNGESGMHVIRIRIITEILLEAITKKYPQYRMERNNIQLIVNASALHDIGKIAISEKILNKPGKLTNEEYEIMKQHTCIADDMLNNMIFGEKELLVRYCHEICRWHHERWDGNGYPDGLVGEQIPISAQVVALADVYDALVSERVYKQAYSNETAVKMILNNECGVFNPLLIDCFIEISDSLEQSIEQGSKKQKFMFDLNRVFTDNMDEYDGLSLSEKEKVQYLRLASFSDDVSFYYEVQKDIMSFYGKSEEEFGLPSVISNYQLVKKRYDDIIDSNSLIDIEACIHSMSYENPTGHVVIRMQRITKEWNSYELALRSLWEKEVCCGIVGHFSKQIQTNKIEDIQSNDCIIGEYQIIDKLAFHKPQYACLLLFRPIPSTLIKNIIKELLQEELIIYSLSDQTIVAFVEAENTLNLEKKCLELWHIVQTLTEKYEIFYYKAYYHDVDSLYNLYQEAREHRVDTK